MATDARGMLEQLRAQKGTDNPARDMLGDLRQREAQRDRATLLSAAQSNPDEFARAKEIETQTGIPADVAARNMDFIDHATKTTEMEDILRSVPVLREKMKDSQFAKLAHDSLDIDAKVERVLNRAGHAVAAVPHNTDVGLAGGVREVAEAIGSPLELALAPMGLPNPLLGLAEAMTKYSAQQKSLAAEHEASYKDAGLIERSIYGGVQSAVQNVPVIAAGLATRNPEVALAGMGALVSGQSYGEARDKGVGIPEAQVYSLAMGGIEAATEMIPVGKLLDDLANDTGFLRMILGQLGSEIPGEQIATITQDLAEWSTLHPENTFGDYLRDRPSAAASTLISTIVGTAMQSGAVHAVSAAAREHSGMTAQAELANANLDRYTELFDLATQSKHRERSPDTFAEFVQHAADQSGDEPENVYVEAEVLNKVLNQAGVKPEDVSPAVAEQLRSALASGGDVRVPIGEFAAHIAPEPYAAQLITHLRPSSDAMSADEAAAFDEGASERLKQQTERVLAETEQKDEADAGSANVEGTILEQLTQANRFTKDVNTAYAALARDFYVTTAAKIGMTPEEMYAKYPLRVTAEELTGGLEQLAPEEIKRTSLGMGDMNIHADKVGGIVVRERGGKMQIQLASVNKERQGEGIGQQFITEAYKYAAEKGQPLVSDTMVSIQQLRAYEALRRKGWTIEYSDPAEVARMLGGTKDEQDTGQLGVDGGHQPVVKRIEPPANFNQSARASATLASANAKAPAAGMTRFRHFGNQLVDQLSPEFMGTGMKGAEQARSPVPSISLYPDTGFQKESGVGPHEYMVDVPSSRLYDADADPQGLLDQAIETSAYTVDDSGAMVPAETRADFTKFEQLVKDAGYIGYVTPNGDGNFKGQARIFEPVSVDTKALKRLRKSGVLFQLSPDQEPHGFATIKPHLSADELKKLRTDTAAKLVTVFKDLPSDADFQGAALAGEAKRGWYSQAERAIRQVFGDIDAPRFAALLAALSPQQSVETNFLNAVRTWANWDEAGRPTDADAINKVLNESLGGERSVLGAWRNNSVRALSAEDATRVTLSGPKVNSFMQNLTGNLQEVTNDTWMANFALIDQTLFSGKLNKSGPGKSTAYVAMNAKIRRVAKKLGWTPAEVQETIWSWAKTAVELADAAGETRSVEDLVHAGAITDAHVAGAIDFATMFKNDATIREILEKAGYGEAINAIELEFGRGATREGAGKTGVTPGLLRSARRLDELRRNRDEDRGTTERATTARKNAGPRALDGLPDSSPGPLPAIQAAAQKYIDELMPVKTDLPPHTRYVHADPERGARIAAAYEAAQHFPDDKVVNRAYGALISETVAQYQVVKDLGIEIEFIKPGQNPYADGPRQLFEDVRRGHLWVFPTELGFGQTATSNHPMLDKTNEYIGDRQLLANDVFRIVHDIFGHAKEGNGFGPNGEENAWQSHVRMYSPLAARAMTAETRGQNSWVNFGPHGEANRASPQQTVYAEQKAALLPQWVSNEGLEAPQVLEQSTPAPAPAPLEQGQGGDTAPRGQISLEGLGATISLLKNADLSTFLHETGHFFLEVYSNIAQQPDSPVAEDFGVLMKWFGTTPEEWATASLEQRRANHEKFARGFEAYLFEGKAPTTELQSTFARFRSWLINVYRSLTALRVELTPEVRSVFDRMLASEQAIHVTENLRKVQPLFGTPEEAGMTPDEWKTYVDANLMAHETAIDELEKRSLRDMRWATNARGRELKKLQADAADKRKSVRDEVEPDVRAEPVYQLLRFFTTGKVREATGEEMSHEIHRLDRETVEKMKLGDKQLAKLEPYLRKNGLEPEQVAQAFGFTSADHMFGAIFDAPPIEDTIEAVTDQRTLEKYGDITNMHDMERAADQAVHSTARQKFVATELRALDKMMSAKADTPRGGSVNVNVKAAKEFAETVIARRKIRELKPGQFAAAESRAAKKAMEELAAGNLEVAAREKRNQLINSYATSAAYAAQDEVEKARRYLKKFDNETTRSALDPSYRDQIDTLLERFDLRKISKREVERRQSLVEWVEAQRAQGFEPEIDDALLNEARRQPFTELTIEQMRGLVDTVRNIEHLARLKHKLLLGAQQRDLAEAVDAASAEVEANALTTREEKLERNTRIDGFVEGVGGFFAMHRKFASILRQMAGNQEGGQLWNLLVRPLNDAGTNEAKMRATATKELMKLFKPILKLGALNGDKQYIPEIGKSLSREGRLAVALNQGNETNRARVTEGDRWSPSQVKAILDRVSKDEWDFVQGVWDYIGTYWPEIAAKQKRVTGVAPEKVAAMPVETKHGTYRGGYYPIKYDASRSSKAEADVDAEAIRQTMQGLYTRATTRRGHTKSRVESVQRPMRKDLGVVFEHLEQVIHDLSFHEYLIDANRILRSSKLDGAIRDHYGPAYLKQLRATLEDVAKGETPAVNAFERSINYLRTGTTVAGLGWNVMTSLLQPIGLTQSMVRIGPKWVARGLREWMGSPQHMQRTVENIYAKSDFMRLRGQTMQREISELRGHIHGGEKMAAAKASLFYLIQKAQVVADVPTWLGAYTKAIENDSDESESIALADQAVLDSQGGGQVKDLAAIQRGGPLQKLWTNFYSFFNTTYNLAAERAGRTNFKKPGDVAKLAADFLLLYVLPATLASALHMAMGGTDDDDDEIAKKLLQDNLSYLLGSMVLARELGGMVNGYDWRGPSGGRFFAALSDLAKQSEQGEVDEAAVKAALNVAGVLFHLPTTQLWRTATGADALAQGDTDNPAALITGAPH